MELSSKKISGRNIQIDSSPDLPLGNESNSLLVNRLPVRPFMVHHKHSVPLKITLDMEAESSLLLIYQQAVSIFLPDHSTPTGVTNEGLKVISQKFDGKRLSIHCEGKPNKKYELGIFNYELAKSISGAELKDGKLIVNIPGTGNDFMKHYITVEIRE